MTISLRKVSKSPLDFELNEQSIAFKGFLQYHAQSLILLKATIKGTLDATCDICAAEYTLDVDEDIEFFISDGVYVDKENSMIDVVEVNNSEVNLDELLQSELELIKSDYYSCPDCEGKDTDLVFD